MEMVIKTSAPSEVLDVSAGAREVVSAISSDAVDRDDEVVLPSGMRRRSHAGMTVFFNHDTAQPVGSCQWAKASGNKLLAKTRFTDKTQLGNDVFNLVQDNVLRSYSIGFRFFDASPPTPEEVQRRPDWAQARRIYRDWELMEYSVVGVPANPDAVTLACSKGLISADMAARLKGHNSTEAEVELNPDAVVWAQRQIISGHVDRASPWSWDPRHAHAWLEQCGGKWPQYGRMFLAIRPGADPETFGAWAFPIGRGGVVYTSALRAALERAAQHGHAKIESAARELLTLIEARKSLGSPVAALIASGAAGRLRAAIGR